MIDSTTMVQKANNTRKATTSANVDEGYEGYTGTLDALNDIVSYHPGFINVDTFRTDGKPMVLPAITTIDEEGHYVFKMKPLICEFMDQYRIDHYNYNSRVYCRLNTALTTVGRFPAISKYADSRCSAWVLFIPCLLLQLSDPQLQLAQLIAFPASVQKVLHQGLLVAELLFQLVYAGFVLVHLGRQLPVSVLQPVVGGSHSPEAPLVLLAPFFCR